uniref:DUF4378 domain-containing protein n=1 Tax=Kalanchoe fedtschenkoi TaxID=63787 RepID=A0A7N0UAN0_KALFE
MEVEKKSSKGGFLSFFDWGGKSRKKLFPNNNGSEFDGIKQVKENHNEPVPRFRLVEYDQNRANLTGKASGEFNCASSTSSDDGYRTGAPSVVARLMGLDSMPNVNVCEPCSTQNVDSRFPRNGYFRESNLNSRIEDFDMKYHGFSYNQDGFSCDPPVLMTPQKIRGRPIERFQTESLPPRSAKTIPVTHHKLLSPIKSPGFIPTKNAAYIMEAASKMIDPNPRAAINGRMVSHASPSVPLRIRDLKDRMEASQKSLRLQKAKENAMRSNVTRKEAITSNGSVDVPKMKAALSSGRNSSDGSRSRVQVGPRAEVVKSDIKRREGPASSNVKNFPSNKVYSEAASKQAVKRSQQGSQRGEQQRVATVRTPGVLRQNNKKQNDTQSGDSLASNNSVSNQQTKKSIPTNSSMRINKTARKPAIDDQTRSRKDVTSTDSAKPHSTPKGMNARQHKRPKNGTNHSEDTMSDMILVSKDGKSIQCNAVIDGSSSWALGNNKDGMDVISFTFASPIKKPASKSEDTGQVMGAGQQTGEGSRNLPNAKTLNLSPQKFNGIGADALGILLEQKLKELAGRLDSSSGTFNESHEASFQDSVPFSNVIKSSPDEYNYTSQYCTVSENSDCATETECASDDLFLTSNRRSREIEDCYSVNKKNEHGKKYGAEPIEDAFSNEGSCSRSENTCSIRDSKWYPDAASFEATNSVSAESYNRTECEADSLEASNRKLATSDSCSVYTASTSWESQYVRDVISQAELVADSYLLGRVDSVIDSNLFDQLEDQPNWSENYADSGSRLERKLLFDCISELTNHRCQQLTTGCCRTWRKWTTVSQQAGLFSRELYKEISSLKHMEELMVDEVVDKDMSSGEGRWVNFDTEASEECIEMENVILSSLVDELVADLLI